MKRNKIVRLMAQIKGISFIGSIPVHLWVTNHQEARELLKQAEIMLK